MGAYNLGVFFTLSLITVAVAADAHECGKRQPIGRQLIFNGYNAQVGAWPWHGAMFYRKRFGADYVCGVTILAKHWVITAASCTIDRQERQLMASERVYVKVGVSSLDSPELGSQQLDITRIVRHDGFKNDTREDNIALMELYSGIAFSEYVQPICLWQGDPSLSMVVSQVGYIVGWGYSDDEQGYGLPKDLKEATMPIASREKCVNSLSGGYLNYYFENKTFCAGYRNETSTTKGDGGGGLYLQVGDSWVIRGIINLKKLDPITLKTDFSSYIIFTDVSSYVGWIKQFFTITENQQEEVNTEETRFSDTTIPSIVHTESRKHFTEVRKCGQRQRKTSNAQALLSNGYKAQAGAWPWHGAMFHRNKNGQTSYACGVTILTEQFVITAYHCTIDPHERQRLPADRVYIKVGLTNLDSPEHFTQQHDVARIIRHEEYDDETFENDIAMLKLFTEITYIFYVQPVCLWQGDANLKNVVSQKGHTVGWGRNLPFGLPKDLHEATMPIVPRRECIDSDPNYYSKYYFEYKTFCAGYRNGTTAAPGDSGGGLFLLYGNSWLLRGIISHSKCDFNTLKVDENSFVVFTDVSHYLDWIKMYVSVDSIPLQAEFPIYSFLVVTAVLLILFVCSCTRVKINNCQLNFK